MPASKKHRRAGPKAIGIDLMHGNERGGKSVAPGTLGPLPGLEPSGIYGERVIVIH
jgi:hypothetical protein